MKYKTKFGFAVMTLALFWHQTVYAAVVAIHPGVLEIKGRVNEEEQTRVIVSNPSPAVSLFDVFSDEFTKSIKVMPASFVLESGAEKELTVNVNFDKTGHYKTQLSVVSRPLSDYEFGAGTGVKVPVSIIMGAEAPLWTLLTAQILGNRAVVLWGAVVFTLLLILALVKIFRTSARL